MNDHKVKLFMQLAGQPLAETITEGTEQQRKLGAQLLLSEVLEYVIYGLGVTPEVNGIAITEPDAVKYTVSEKKADTLEMLDGLADVAYTMYWNANAFGLPLEEGFELVSQNNLEKFVELENWSDSSGEVQREAWHLGKDVHWPTEVSVVEVVHIEKEGHFAVGKDGAGKVRKPSHYKSVDLKPLVSVS